MGWAQLIFLAALLALPAHAQQSCNQAASEAPTITFDGERPIAGGSISASFTGTCYVISIYRSLPKLALRKLTAEQRAKRPHDERPWTGAPHFYARVHRNWGGGALLPPQWVDQATCPALLPVIEGMERALAPKLTGDGPTRGGVGPGIPTDGANVHVWTRGLVYPDGAMGDKFDIDYHTNLGTPTSDWMDDAIRRMRPCLSDTMPTPDPPLP